METKICTKCKIEKPISEYHIMKGGKRPGLIPSECKMCKNVYSNKFYYAHKEAKLDWFAKRYQRIKDAVFGAYGGYVCACCGETEKMFLTIDHTNNDGSAHRKSITKKSTDVRDYRSSTGYKTYGWLVKNNFPEGFQVLCQNCNAGKQRNGGVCPHKTSEGSTTTESVKQVGYAQAGGSAKLLRLIKTKDDDIVCSAL